MSPHNLIMLTIDTARTMKPRTHPRISAHLPSVGPRPAHRTFGDFLRTPCVPALELSRTPLLLFHVVELHTDIMVQEFVGQGYPCSIDSYTATLAFSYLQMYDRTLCLNPLLMINLIPLFPSNARSRLRTLGLQIPKSTKKPANASF